GSARVAGGVVGRGLLLVPRDRDARGMRRVGDTGARSWAAHARWVAGGASGGGRGGGGAAEHGTQGAQWSRSDEAATEVVRRGHGGTGGEALVLAGDALMSALGQQMEPDAVAPRMVVQPGLQAMGVQ